MPMPHLDRGERPDNHPPATAGTTPADIDAELAVVLPQWDLLPPVEFVQRHRKP